jgi:hypothetical protein
MHIYCGNCLTQLSFASFCHNLSVPFSHTTLNALLWNIFQEPCRPRQRQRSYQICEYDAWEDGLPFPPRHANPFVPGRRQDCESVESVESARQVDILVSNTHLNRRGPTCVADTTQSAPKMGDPLLWAELISTYMTRTWAQWALVAEHSVQLAQPFVKSRHTMPYATRTIDAANGRVRRVWRALSKSGHGMRRLPYCDTAGLPAILFSFSFSVCFRGHVA